MAEALVEIGDPLETVLAPGPAAPVAEVVRALARSAAPAEADLAPPEWLRPEQRRPFRRAVAAIRWHGGALLADPVGSGKTWIALAVSAALAPEVGAVAVVPAVLREQWRLTSGRLGIPLTIVSHEAVSRGRLPEVDCGCVLIDESHHFRNPGTRRYDHLSRWLVDQRQVLLLSATPVVNRMDDLAHQLLLAVRDDALITRGCPSLFVSLTHGDPHPALGDIVLCRPRPTAMPAAGLGSFEPSLEPLELEMLEAIDRLVLSRDRGIAALVRTVLWRALGSSPGALAGAVSRYLRLLDHAGHAADSGRRATRSAIRAFAGADQEQLLLWALLPPAEGPADLALEDREALVNLVSMAQSHTAGPDSKCAALARLLNDGAPTIVFSTSRDTIHWLRTRLGDSRPAWVTGDGAGIGATRLPRRDVLTWFRPDAPLAVASHGPRLLLATDVAAEGLDLQAAERVVHYDLPWTSVRLDQRAGRALRLGAARDRVEVLTFRLPAMIETRLRQLARLTEKAGLTRQAGLDHDGRQLFRWIAELAEWGEQGAATAGIAVAEGAEPGWLVGLGADATTENGPVRTMPASLLWIGDDGEVSGSPDRLETLLHELACRRWRAPAAGERRAAFRAMAPVVRSVLRQAASVAWRGARISREQRALAGRLRRLGAALARRRDREGLALVDRALDWLGGGLSAGEAALVRDAEGLGPTRLFTLLRQLLASPRHRVTLVPRLTGVVRVTSFSECQPSEPCCSTSTAP